MSLAVMEQALSALETVVVDAKTTPNAYEASRQAITALRAAIEQAQEPIGHADLGMSNIYIFSALEPREIPVGRTPLYTAPRREWQGLTDEEITEIAATPAAIPGSYVASFARAIEAKLKERNKCA